MKPSKQKKQKRAPATQIKPELIRLARVYIVQRGNDHESFLEMCREAVSVALAENLLLAMEEDEL